MIGTLILTHGGLARELLIAARTIAGPLPATEALSLDWNDCFEPARDKVRAAIARLDSGQGVLILADMFGSTPHNVAMTFFAPGKVEILSGVNLPMLLRLACTAHPIENLPELAHWLQAKGQRSIQVASDYSPASPGSPGSPGSRGTQGEQCDPRQSRCETAPVAVAEKVDG